MSALGKQVFGDRMALWRMRASIRPFFHAGLDTPTIREHLEAMDIAAPDLPERGQTLVGVETLAGQLRAGLKADTRAGRGAPVVIFHHDGGEIPFTRTFDKIFPTSKKNAPGLNLIAVRAPFHESKKAWRNATASLFQFAAMEAAAIGLTERLMDTPLVADAPVVAVAGYGQGGYIANWHHHLFDSADVYVPLMAGTAQAEIFLSSVPTARAARAHADRLRAILNLDGDWNARPHPNVFPVLGSADFINRFNIEARFYGDTPIEVWPAGHSDITQIAGRLREKILRHVVEAEGERRLSA